MTDTSSTDTIAKHSSFRPKIHISTAENRGNNGFVITMFILAFAVYWTLIPIWPVINTEILGDADTDAIRGMWGFDHICRSLLPPNTPIYSHEINFPNGVIALTLPWTTGVLLSPLGFVFGPIVAWNLSIACILLALGLSTAWLLKQLTNSWSIGCAIGGLVMTQPMLLHAISDGTPEHLSLWGVPLLLGTTWKACKEVSPKWGLFAGLSAVLVALDSPYHAIYATLTGLIILPWAFIRRWKIEERLDAIWTLGAVLGICVLGGGLLLSVYSLFPLGESATEDYISLWKMNATDLRVWWRHDFQTSVMRDASLVPTTIPMPILWFSFAMILFGLPRSIPWAFAGILMLNLSLGLNEKLPVHLSYWIGSFGYPIGNQILNINAHLYAFPGLGEIRFPQRWLVPSALCFVVGAGIGISQLRMWLEKRFSAATFSSAATFWKIVDNHSFWLAGTTVALGTFFCVRSAQIDLHFPKQELPHIQFAEYIAEQPNDGAIIMLPQMRPPPKSGKRSDIPVFSNIAESLSSSDVQYFQTIHGRPIYDKPSLKTLYAIKGSEYIYRLVKEWDDLAHPLVTGNPIPASAYDERFTKRRRIGLDQLMTAGLRWLVIDLGAYNQEALEILDKQIHQYEINREYFNEGDGVLVIELDSTTATSLAKTEPNTVATEPPVEQSTEPVETPAN